MANIKICRVATVPFSFVSQLMQQIEFIKKEGMDVYLVSSYGTEAKELEKLEGIIYHPIEIPRSLSPWKDIKALLALFLFFRKYRFDIVHSITPKAGLLSAIAAFLARVPVRLHTWTGQPWVTRTGLLRFFSMAADRVIGLLNTKCYADSRTQADFLIQEKIVSPSKIDVIGVSSIAGVNMDRFSNNVLSDIEKACLKADLGIQKDDRVIVFIGRISREKGIMELMSAFQQMVLSGLKVHLLLVGPKDEECGGAKTIHLDELTVDSRVSYVGYTPMPEIYLAISDILCLPSYREGFGTVVIEAAAMGIPTVGTLINGLKDAVSNHETGLLVKVGDDQALCESLKILVENSQLREKMGAAAKKRCKVLFDADLINRKTVEAYISFCHRDRIQSNS